MVFEHWKPIPGYEGRYEVSDLGHLRTFAKSNSERTNPWPRLMHPDVNKGYLRIVLWKNRKGKRQMVHLLVMHAFVGPKPVGLECNHKDGNRSNAALSNLEYITKSQNERHKFDVLGTTINQGSAHPMAKLNESMVRQIRQLSAKGWTGVAISSRFHICAGSVSLIINRKTWRHA